MINNRYTSLLVFLTLSLSASGALSMSLFEPKKVCLFSAISGVITLNGEPAKGAQVKRIVEKFYSSGHNTDETMTDDNGYFELPAVFDQSFLGKFLPGEFSIPQQIFVTYGGEEYPVWQGVKRTIEENAESRGKPLQVDCMLGIEHNVIWVNGGAYVTQCTWSVEADKIVTGFENE
ncbi:DUF6795 domain-containing protein [Thalassolituus sp.]|jgi:hypothetical protein|uniref:DUF6795 domain-containing protein n=1 Tax=Thalassolituus sp. TaxID=2030822 RepID=UPI002A825ACA|nr:DUF6795 domain-containing protein [Thalassolituus sp.]